MVAPAEPEKLAGRVIAGVLGGAMCGAAWGGLVARLSDGNVSGMGDTSGGMAALLVWLAIMILAFVEKGTLAAWRMVVLATLLPAIGLALLRSGTIA